MKISDIKFDGSKAISKRNSDGTEEIFYMDVSMEANMSITLLIKYDVRTKIVSKIRLNGRVLPLDDYKVLEDLNMVLEYFKSREKETKRVLKTSDIHLKGFQGIRKCALGEIEEEFYIAGLNTILLKYKKSTGDIVSLRVNAKEVPLDDFEIINQLNSELDKLASPGSGPKFIK